MATLCQETLPSLTVALPGESTSSSQRVSGAALWWLVLPGTSCWIKHSSCQWLKASWRSGSHQILCHRGVCIVTATKLLQGFDKFWFYWYFFFFQVLEALPELAVPLGREDLPEQGRLRGREAHQEPGDPRALEDPLGQAGLLEQGDLKVQGDLREL